MKRPHYPHTFALVLILMATAAAFGNPIINEFMADNDSTIADEDGNYPDWIELYNPTAAPISLAGWHLTDEADNLDKWQFPAVTIHAGEYLLVFASGKDRAVAGSEFHTDFKLSADGEYLALVAPNGITVVQEFTPKFPPQVEDVSYGFEMSSEDATFLSSGAPARAWVPTSGADEAVWMNVGYDDSAWATGTTGIGYDEAETYIPLIGLDVEATMNNQNETVWVRIPFNIADPTAVQALTLRMKYDDGFVAYLNGVAVASENILGVPPLPYDEGATQIHSDTSAVLFVDYNISAFRGSLIAGENILAIHGLNKGDSSSDMLILPELVGAVSAGGQIGDLRYFVLPMPEGVNADGILGYVEEVEFSHDRGFYADSFMLTLWSDTPDAQIRYTLDGTEPTSTHGSVYGAPIGITTTTVVRAAAFKAGYTDAEPVTSSYIFLADVLTQGDDQSARDFPATWYAGASSSGSYDRQSRPGDYEMDPVIVNDPTYGPQMMDAMTSIPTVSLTFDPDDLWDSSGGMYPNSIMRASSNIFWEKPASMELLDPDGLEEGFSINAGARISGELARWPAVNDKQSIRVVFRTDYGPGKLNYDFFGDGGVDKFDTILLRANWGDGWLRDATRGPDLGISWLREGPETSQYLRDIFLHDSFRATGNVNVRCRLVHLYLNGVYWGLYEALERPDNSFGAENFGGSKDDYDVVKGTLEDVGRNGTLKDGSRTAWDAMFYAYFDTNSSGYSISGQVTPITDADLIALEQYLNVDQFIDYMITLWTYNRQDFPRKNWYTFCQRNPAGGAPLVPFTFYTWDSEASVGQGVDEASRWPDSTEVLTRWNNDDDRNDTGPVRMYRRLITNATFRQRWADRAQALMLNGGPLDAANSIARYTARAAEADTAIIGESARWGDSPFEWGGDPIGVSTRDGEWLTELSHVLDAYFPTRTGHAIDQMRSVGLFPSVQAPVFTQHGGEFDPGFLLFMSNPNGFGTIWYTLDGADPRTSASAIQFTAPIALPGAVFIRAAVNASNTWSAVNEVGFMPTGGPTLAISEIMYNPPASDAGSPYDSQDFEFIELLNTGAAGLDIRSIAFADGVEFDFSAGSVPALAPGQYVLVVKNLAAFQQRYGAGLPVAGVFTGSLDNDGETLTLTAAGLTYKSFAYNDADNWPGRPDGRGASLERDDFGIDPADDNAWRSSGEYLGTPGTAGVGPFTDIVINEVLTHTDLDPTDSIELYNASAGPVDISGWRISDSWDNFLKFEIPDGTVLESGEYVVFDESDFNPAPGSAISFALSGAHGDDVWLMEVDAQGDLARFADHVEFGGAFNGMSFGRWPNGFGDLYPMTARTFGFDNSGPRAASVRISEVMYNPGGAELDDLEFIEIYNATGADQDMTDWRIRKGVDYDFDPDFMIAAGERIVVLSFNPDKFENASRVGAFRTAYGIDASVVLVGGWGGKLDNAGESLQLQQPDSPPAEEPYFTPHVLEDEVVYDSLAPWPLDADGMGDSLHRIGGGWGNDPASWTAGEPSPGTGTDLTPGDADGDGDVDLDDFVTLKVNFGRTDVVVGPAEGDFDNDGDVDLDDFVILKVNFGS